MSVKSGCSLYKLLLITHLIPVGKRVIAAVVTTSRSVPKVGLLSVILAVRSR